MATMRGTMDMEAPRDPRSAERLRYAVHERRRSSGCDIKVALGDNLSLHSLVLHEQGTLSDERTHN